MFIQVCPITRSFNDEGLTYIVEDNLKINIGSIVEVPFGKQQIDAVVLAVDTGEPETDISKIKSISRVKYPESFLSDYQIELLHFISRHYFCLLHNSLSLFLPKNVKEKIKKEKILFDGGELTYVYENSQKLTTAQNEKLEEIVKTGSQKTLFYGVTGSGKTSIYIELIKKQLDEGKQSLLLVPEIILTSQIAFKISEIFGENVLVLNSSVSDAKKTKMWLAIHSGDAKVIVGTRSALFYPYKNLGTIIIDEEHDRSYKSDTNPRYDAREAAFKISEFLDIPLILGSGTPSINMMYKAIKKEINLVTLLEEYKN